MRNCRRGCARGAEGERRCREFLAYDPAVDLARCCVPVLAITGGKDLQIDPDQLDAIRVAVAGPVTISRPPDVTHTLRRQPGRPSLLAYWRELRRPVDPGLLAEVRNWTASTLDDIQATTEREGENTVPVEVE